MSFILDALRKSENERQRGAVPSISHVPFAVARHRLPTWALGVIVALAVAVLALGGAWWQSTRSGPEMPAGTISASENLQVPVAIPPPSQNVRPAQSPSIRPPPVSLADLAPRSAGRDAAAAAAPPRDEPAVRSETQPAARTRFTREVPTAASLLSQGIAVPPLRLELSVYYDDRPNDRFVIINGRRYREGERLPEGPRVVTIESNGVILDLQGREFLLSPE